MKPAGDALAALGMSLEEVLDMDSVLRTRPPIRDGRICICGHAVSKHTSLPNGKIMCKPSKMDCPCHEVRAVIDVEDTRPFLRRTQGGGSMHALSRGLAALATSGKGAQWIIDLECDNCHEFSESLTPVPVTGDGRVSGGSEPTGYDRMLCLDCRTGVNNNGMS